MKKNYIFGVTLLVTAASCSTAPGYDATGIFEATTVTVSAETSGKIMSFAPCEGDTLTCGQQVALIDTTLLALQRDQISSQRNSTEKSSPDIAAQAAALRSQIAQAEQEQRRQENLLAAHATTRKMYDDATANVRTLRSQLEALLSTLNKNKGSITDNALALHYQTEQIAEQIERCHIKSPVAGTILTKFAQAGEFATPGKPLYKIADLNDIYLRAYFTASQLAEISIGQRVTVIADFGGDEQFEYPGTITWIAEESEFTPKSIQTKDSRANLVYAVKIAVPNDGRLKLGQYGEVVL